MTKRDLVLKIVKETGYSRSDVVLIAQKTINSIADDLIKGNRCEFRRFGTFEVKIRKSKIGRNPKSPTNTIVIPEHASVKFKPSNELKTAVNEKFSKL